MCVNALTEINKTYPNLSFFFFFFPSEVPLEKKAGRSSGISSIKNGDSKAQTW